MITQRFLNWACGLVGLIAGGVAGWRLHDGELLKFFIMAACALVMLAAREWYHKNEIRRLYRSLGTGDSADHCWNPNELN